ncbi:uncharacterized protein B0T15DRAFT_216863 [Chaetomium strumarium]|uniref:Uncharacterized protein n=1 Tax=Chaetomium strumarium TaxID=1170767 RepID=A0AAJ0GU00_9PEZI|nr:hypothetical protein B0T15DRAFT_216863 [Chaetomium strumarium]
MDQGLGQLHITRVDAIQRSNSSADLHWLIPVLERLRCWIISTSCMAQTDRSHQNCTPWTPFTLQDIFAICKVEDFVSFDEDYFKKQAEKSGIKASGSMKVGNNLRRGNHGDVAERPQRKKARN